MERAFLTTAPFGFDKLSITRNMDTSSLATTFPLTSAELSGDTGVLYGINSQNESFIIFDRFSLENSNMTIFATSGAGKSFFVKLESLRSLMLGVEVIVLDPESEYKTLADAVGGEFISFSFSSPSKINPFDLSQIYEEGENQLGLKILTLHSFFKVIMGELDPIKEALLDRALVMTYRAKGITQDPETQKKEPPLMEDLYKTLIGMETKEALDLASRIEKFVRGSFVGIFDKQTNIKLDNPFTVFSVKDMQEALRPIAMFMILDFIWTRVQRNLKRRLLVVDEAWHMMRYEDSAQFLWSIVKRARKYFLGLTTITQDVEDFLARDIGKAIVTNSALRLLLKQSPAAIDKVGEIFYLSQGEKQLLMAANIGEGIFFAGPHHAPIRVVASPEEYKLITTNPMELEKRNQPNQLSSQQASVFIKPEAMTTV
jgi:type IV secretory pathway VirB4 component